MSGIVRKMSRRSLHGIVRFIKMIPKAGYRLGRLVIFQTLRLMRFYVRPFLRKFRIFQHVEYYVLIVFAIFQHLRSVIRYLFSWRSTDGKKLETVANLEPRGLDNLGNTCYFNSAMQPLFHTNRLRELLMEHSTFGDLTESLRNVYTDMLSGKSGSFSPQNLHQIFARECSRFDNRKQHDSHECLRNFLDSIRQEERRQLEITSSGSSGTMLTVVDRVFGGQMITVYICLSCQGPYHVFEPCLDLSLPICFERPGKRVLCELEKDSQTTANDNGLGLSEDETSEDSQLETNYEGDEIRKTLGEEEDEGNVENENIEKEDEKDQEGEEEEVDVGNEDIVEKDEIKQKEDNTKKRVVGVDENVVDSYEEIKKKTEGKHYKEEKNKEKEATDMGRDEKYNNKEEAEDGATMHPNARMKEKSKLKEEHTEEKEVDEAVEERNIHIEKRPYVEEKFDNEGKHEKEDLEDDDNIRYDDENRHKRSETKKKERGSTESVGRTIDVSQELSDASWTVSGTLNTSEDQMQSNENDSYRIAISLLMETLRTYSTSQLSSIDSSPKSVEECLMYYTRKEHINEEYLCNDCRAEHIENGSRDTLLTSATKQTLIFSPPAFLTLHLKRFELKPGGSVKRTDRIKYDSFLDMAPFCSSKCLRNEPMCKNIWYSLYAVIVHSGTLEFGHYTAYVKVQRSEQQGSRRFLQTEYFDRDKTREELRDMMMNDERKATRASGTDAVWYCANDSSISEVSLEEVLDKEAYLLFYERLT